MVDPPPLVRPVEGPVAARFTYDRATPFRRGRRRIVRFAAETGEAVVAPCSGRVAYAGPTPEGPGVTLRCRGWSVTLTGVTPTGVRPGRVVGAGRTVARARATVGLGVRRASDPFGYLDPSPLLRGRDPARPFVPLGPAPGRPPAARTPAPVPPAGGPAPAPAPRRGPTAEPVRAPRPVPAGRPVPSTQPVPVGEPAPDPTADIPTVGWVGLVLVALGLPAGGLRSGRRRARSGATRARAARERGVV